MSLLDYKVSVLVAMQAWLDKTSNATQALFDFSLKNNDEMKIALWCCVGLRNRANGSNTVNEHSSRSHSVLTLNIDSEIYDEEDEKLCMTRHGKLAFVDLAGAPAIVAQ